MIVTFVSQCEKNALKKTRRVLDAFANRIGDNTWQTVITMEGLQTVKKMLRQTASKNTAVSCHRIRSRKRSEFMWVVGSQDKFNEQGIVPVNSTKKDVLNAGWENDWKYLPLIKALAALSGLLHDWGKASKLFQAKLQPGSKTATKGDPIRHEWVSCVLLRSFIETNGGSESDGNWLSALSYGVFDENEVINNAKEYIEQPVKELPFIASMVMWLILSHHRLPVDFDEKGLQGESANSIDYLFSLIAKDWGYENRCDDKGYEERLSMCFDFPEGLGSNSPSWLKQIKKWSAKLLDCQYLAKQAFEDGSWRQIIHYARLCLMLGDHYFSSQENDNQWPDTTSLYANTDRKTKKLKQKYDEHLVGVTKNALRTAHLLPAFEKEPPVAQDIRALKQLSPKEFRWQDKAVKQISEWKGENKEDAGFFVVNMASTGCGKTFANAKIMQALSNDKNSLRYILALGLRTLTLQTGDEYRGRIGLDNTELAVLIGSKAVQELHDQRTETDEYSEFESEGSESEELLLDESVDFDCAIPEDGLATVLTREKDRKFLYAPVLACTIDHIMGATETKRGGKYILPFLRLMSSHLVIDEVDDFTGSDLIAIGRLIHLAGMLGRKVMISSATIPPDLAEGYFNAYRAGRRIFSAARDRSCKIGCAWVDEFTTQVVSVEQVNQKSVNKYYREKHADFITIRVKQLQKQSAKRKANICYCSDIIELSEANSEETIKEQYFNKFKQAIIEKHSLHCTVDKITGKNISFGVVRMANIKPCIELTKFLLESEFPNGIEIRTMAYHSQQVLLLRHEQEKHLDKVLKRKEEQPKWFENNIIRNHIDSCCAENLIFILVATPVEEVGRDHDFDWAVVEPSSYRSIVQLAGRVRRHRKEPVQNPNISLLQYNWKAIRSHDKPNKPCFIKPGYEGNSKKTRLNTHDLSQLLDVEKIESCIDAIPRVKKSNGLDHRSSLADLEHYVTHTLLTNYEMSGPDSMQGYLDESWHLTAMPQQMHQFRKSEPSLNLYLYFAPEKEKLVFAEKDHSGEMVDIGNIYSVKSINFEIKNLERLWLDRDYLELLGRYSQQQELSDTEISRRYGELSFIYREGNEYEYSDQFGLVEV